MRDTNKNSSHPLEQQVATILKTAKDDYGKNAICNKARNLVNCLSLHYERSKRIAKC